MNTDTINTTAGAYSRFKRRYLLAASAALVLSVAAGIGAWQGLETGDGGTDSAVVSHHAAPADSGSAARIALDVVAVYEDTGILGNEVVGIDDGMLVAFPYRPVIVVTEAQIALGVPPAPDGYFAP